MQANSFFSTSFKKTLTSILGNHLEITEIKHITGGDINDTFALTINDGSQLFMKCNKKDNISFFRAEATGLKAIAQTDTIATPHILSIGTEDSSVGRSFMLMEFMKQKRRISNYWETFAHQLAAMHQAPTQHLISAGGYGFIENNYIGARPQINSARQNWTSFFRDCRLEPQFKDAEHYFQSTDIKKIIRLLDQIDHLLIEPEHPSLLHGDLWSGNVITGNDGKAWLIDPAVYIGHAEADLAMTELFGGFPQTFYAAYQETSPLQPGYERRRDLYNLYHLLNHLNMFGSSYLSSVKRILREYIP